MRLPDAPERYDKADQAATRRRIEQELVQLAAGSLVVKSGIAAVSGSGIATDLFPADQAGLYLVFAFIPLGGETYLTEGLVVSDGTAASVRQQATGATFNIVLSTSGNVVRGAQFSGASSTIQFRYLRVG